MRYDLRTIARRTRKTRRRSVTLRDIVPPAVMASDLFATAYAPVIALWLGLSDRIIVAYERTLSGLTTDSSEDINRILEEGQNELTRLLLLLRPAMTSWALRVEKWHRGKWRGAVLAASGVDIDTLIGSGDVRQTLGAAIDWNVNLVSDVSAQAKQRIASSVFDGLRNRTPARDVAKSIRAATGMARDRSVRIASDQLTKITSSLASERRREAGLDKWEWKSSHKLHFRPEHAARDGKVYSDDDAPEDKPGQLPWCGCRELAVLDFD